MEFLGGGIHPKTDQFYFSALFQPVKIVGRPGGFPAVFLQILLRIGEIKHRFDSVLLRKVIHDSGTVHRAAGHRSRPVYEIGKKTAAGKCAEVGEALRTRIVFEVVGMGLSEGFLLIFVFSFFLEFDRNRIAFLKSVGLPGASAEVQGELRP